MGAIFANGTADITNDRSTNSVLSTLTTTNRSVKASAAPTLGSSSLSPSPNSSITVTSPTRSADIISNYSLLKSTASGSHSSSAQPSSTIVQGLPKSSKNHGVANESAAGIALACVVLGATIAASVWYLIFRRRVRQPHTIYARQNVQNTEEGSDSAKNAILMTNLEPTASVNNGSDLFPQAVDERKLMNVLGRIEEQIRLHAQTFYHASLVQVTDVSSSYLDSLADAANVDVINLIDLLVHGNTRQNTICSTIAWVVFSRCDGRGAASFIPNGVSSLASAIMHSIATGQTSMYNEWKVVTADFARQQRNRGGFITDTERDCIARAIEDVDDILAPFVHKLANGKDRRRDLELVIDLAVDFSMLLFAQPGSFLFDFRADDGCSISPKLLQTLDHNGYSLSPQRVIWEM